MDSRTQPQDQGQNPDQHGGRTLRTGRPLVDGTPTDGPTLELTPESTASVLLRQSPQPLVSDPVNRTWATLLEHPESGETDNPVMIQWVSPASPEPPIHYHPTTETFRALEGTVTIVHEGDTSQLAPGESLTVKPEQNHTFRNDTDEIVAFQAELPSIRTVKGLYTTWGLAHERGNNEDGTYSGPGLLQSLVVAADLYDETIIPMAPLPVQRLFWAIVQRVTWLSGATGIADAYLEASFWHRYVEQPEWG